jgi:hypothetical protein
VAKRSPPDLDQSLRSFVCEMRHLVSSPTVPQPETKDFLERF